VPDGNKDTYQYAKSSNVATADEATRHMADYKVELTEAHQTSEHNEPLMKCHAEKV